jgi:hypothetical protein
VGSQENDTEEVYWTSAVRAAMHWLQMQEYVFPVSIVISVDAYHAI